MATFVLTFHVILCILLILIILVQPGKGGDISATFGGGSSTQLFGAAGPGNFLTRGTGVIAFLFMVTTVSLAKMGGGLGGDSVDKSRVDELLDAAPAKTPETKPAEGATPAAPATTPAAPEQAPAPTPGPTAPQKAPAPSAP